MISKAQVMALADGDSWLEKGANLLMFGPPGPGKSPLGRARPGAGGGGWRVLVHAHDRPRSAAPAARRELRLEAAIARLDKDQLLIRDDLAYVSKEQAETCVLFELIAAR